jgi:hypothetical protein
MYMNLIMTVKNGISPVFILVIFLAAPSAFGRFQCDESCDTYHESPPAPPVPTVEEELMQEDNNRYQRYKKRFEEEFAPKQAAASDYEQQQELFAFKGTFCWDIEDALTDPKTADVNARFRASEAAWPECLRRRKAWLTLDPNDRPILRFSDWMFRPDFKKNLGEIERLKDLTN